MTVSRPVRIALVAGEDSGDHLGAELIHGLRALQPDCELLTVAGPKMRATGVTVLQPAEAFSVMGLAEVLRHLPRLLRLRQAVFRGIRDFKPDILVGIDAPDLNLPMEARFKRAGVKTVHYVSPSVWAWRPGRAKSIARKVDAVLTLFPFEPSWYLRHGGQAEFVGHPLAQSIPLNIDKGEHKAKLGEPADTPLVAMLPGSRWHELRALSDDFLQAAVLLRQHMPDVRFVSANTHDDKCRWFSQEAAKAGVPLRMLPSASEALLAADAAILASGTVALEAMLCKTPMVVAYRVSPVTYAIVKGLKLMKQPWYSLPNVLEEDFLVPEIMQNDLSPQALADAAIEQLTSGTRKVMLERFTYHHRKLLPPVRHAAARAVLQVAGC